MLSLFFLVFLSIYKPINHTRTLKHEPVEMGSLAGPCPWEGHPCGLLILSQIREVGSVLRDPAPSPVWKLMLHLWGLLFRESCSWGSPFWNTSAVNECYEFFAIMSKRKIPYCLLTTKEKPHNITLNTKLMSSQEKGGHEEFSRIGIDYCTKPFSPTKGIGSWCSIWLITYG